MHPVPEWRRVLRHAWSIRLMLLAGLLSAGEAAWPLLGGELPIAVSTAALINGAIVGAAFVARLLAQRELPEAQGEDWEDGDGR